MFPEPELNTFIKKQRCQLEQIQHLLELNLNFCGNNELQHKYT